jgi:hypothetical protein
MKRYGNRNGTAGVWSYDYGPKWIRVSFARGGTYEYTRESVGAENLRKMKRLADAGEGLTTFINQHPVKMGYRERVTGEGEGKKRKKL